MYRVDLYINGQKADLFQDESIEMNLSVQNVNDISKVFGDYSQSFSIPASVANNAIFKHYYNVDISGSFDALVRINAFIEINNNLYKNGTLELETVQMQGGEPYAYQVGFYSKVTSLKDSFLVKISSMTLTYQHTIIHTAIRTLRQGSTAM